MVNLLQIKKDIHAYRERFEELKESILDLLAEHTYRYERYDQEYSSMLVYSEERPIDIGICRGFVRKSDHVYRLYENLVLVMFDMADASTSYKAAQNFLHEMQKRDVTQENYFALAPICQEDTAIDIGSRLLILLDYAISESMPNSIVDMDCMRMK